MGRNRGQSKRTIYYGLMVLIALVILYYGFSIVAPTSNSHSSSGADNSKVSTNDGMESGDIKLEIFMESQCPDTYDFLKEQLLPTWPKIQSFVDLKLYPYGKVRENKNDKTNDYNFQCQHGPTECLVNQMMCCVINRLNNDSGLYLPVVLCLQNSQPSELRKCLLKSTQQLDHDDIHKCATSEEGQLLHHEAGIATNGLRPRLFFVPWILINGKREPQAFDDLTKTLCEKYTGHKKLTFCSRS
uniref:Uncharacterized protein n=1 Tax=Romanomermis culicivorax TaxID=13658 RepID=A0A915KLE2_ROMCU